MAAAKPAPKEKSLAPIVVKRVKKGDHGHHGGVWKIAYADFVTAMMAFFLLMWVLGSTTTGDLAGISAYFQNPLRISLQGGQGSGDATRPMKGGGENLFRTEGQEARADSFSNQRKVSDYQTNEGRVEKQILDKAKEKIEQEIDADPVLADLKNQVFIAVGVEGLRIQIVDDKNRPMFAVGSAEPLPYTRRLLRTIGKVLSELTNAVRFEGHTDNRQFGNGPAGYGNWELSSERANAARRELVVGGMAEQRTAQVAGYADSMKLNTDDASDPVNRRISITVLRNKPTPAEQKPAEKTQSPAQPAGETKPGEPVPVLPGLSGLPGVSQSTVGPEKPAAVPAIAPAAPSLPAAAGPQPPVAVPPRQVATPLPAIPAPGVPSANPSRGAPYYKLPPRPGLSLPPTRAP